MGDRRVLARRHSAFSPTSYRLDEQNTLHSLAWLSELSENKLFEASHPSLSQQDKYWRQVCPEAQVTWKVRELKSP